MMKKITVLLLLAALLHSCGEPEPANNPPLEDLLGVWDISLISHRECDALGCQTTNMDFSGSGLTFELSANSASYFPDVGSPSTINAYSVQGYSNNTLRLQDSQGTWDFEVSEYNGGQVTITGEFPTADPDVVSYDVIFLER